MGFYSVIDTSLGSITSSTNSEAVGIHHSENLAVQVVWTNDTPSAGTFTAAATDILTKSSHGYTTGLKVQVSSTTTLPAGLSASTDYFVVVIDTNTFYLSDTLAHALAGTNIIDISSTGTGTHTITPTSLAGGVVHLECSVDKVNWFDVASMTANMTSSSSTLWHITNAGYMYVRLNAVVTAGQVTVSAKVAQKGEGLG